MKKFAGIDLHSNNAMCAITDSQGKRLSHKRLPCDLDEIDGFLKPHKKELVFVAVESTFNWYWLVDGLEDRDYHVELANPARMEQYAGLKHTDDKSDAYFMGDLSRLGILPTSYIYDRKIRPIRDLLRRRLLFVEKRTAMYLSFKSMFCRNTGKILGLSKLKQTTIEAAFELYEHEAHNLVSGEQMKVIDAMSDSIKAMEDLILEQLKPHWEYRTAQTLPGVGKILGMTLCLETGPITRFPSPGDLASYARTVNANRYSNHKKKGKNNSHCGNRYLAWAFVEVAHMARRYDIRCRDFFDRKAKQVNTSVATKALACKLAKALWHMLKHETPFDPEKAFPLNKNNTPKLKVAKKKTKTKKQQPKP